MRKKVFNPNNDTISAKNSNCTIIKVDFEIDLSKCNSNFLSTIIPEITNSEILHTLAKYVISQPDIEEFYDIAKNIIKNKNISADTLHLLAQYAISLPDTENSYDMKMNIIKNENVSANTLHLLAKYVISHPNTEDFYDIKMNIIENSTTSEDTIIFFAENEKNEFVRAHLLDVEHTLYLTNLLAQDNHWYIITKILTGDDLIGVSKFEDIIERVINDELILPKTKNDFEEFLTAIYEHEYMKKDAVLRDKVENKISNWVDA